MYLPFRAGLSHHALGDEPPTVDDALMEEMHAKGLIDIDYRANNWNITPTPLGRQVVEEQERSRTDQPAGDVAVLTAAFARQSEASNPLAWPAVRPVLEALREQWKDAGYPEVARCLGGRRFSDAPGKS
jgi:hypothetical protein